MSDNVKDHKRIARCGCGELMVTTRGEPQGVHACSCFACQRETGSVFSYCAVFPKRAVSFNGQPKFWRRTVASGRWLESIFCPICATTVMWRSEHSPKSVGVAAGCFADPDFPAPTMMCWTARAHRWLAPPQGVELFQKEPE